jgi:AcrR family transcriptional regulator
MATRSYVSPLRTAAAGEKRARVIKAAGHLLREEASIAGFSLDAVAKTAGVTRLTVYKQFGSRRGLLEAVFDERAREGGLGRIREAMALADPHAALDHLIEIFCGFWSSDEAVGRLHDAAATDAEFAQALAARNERRRDAIAVLVGRMAPQIDNRARDYRRDYRDVVDLIFGLTSYAMFRVLRTDRAPEAVCTIVKSACSAVIDRLNGPGSGLQQVSGLSVDRATV